MNKLGIMDASFLYAETSSTPMNIASLQLLELPAGAETPFTLDQPVWVDATDFDIDAHVQRLVLPPPGGERQLEAVVARLHETPLDRRRPLWAFCFIEGLGGDVAPSSRGGRVVGWYCKYHHACIDGMAGQGIIDVLFSEDPDVTPAPTPKVAREAEPGFFDLLFDAAKSVVSQSLSAGEQLGECLGAAHPVQCGGRTLPCVCHRHIAAVAACTG